MPEPRPNICPARDPERINRVSPRLVLSALGVLVAGMIMLGCGLEGQPFDSQRENDSSPVVSGEDISAEEVGSQRRTVLEWWRGVQTRNPDIVVSAYTPDVRDELPKTFDFSVVAVLAPSASRSSITIDSLETKGNNKATLFASIDSPNAAMNGPLALPMEKAGDKWLIANSTFLNLVAGSTGIEKALKKAAPPPSKAKEPSGE